MALGLNLGHGLSIDPSNGKMGFGVPINRSISVQTTNFYGTSAFGATPRKEAAGPGASDGYDGRQKAPHKKADYGASPYKKAVYGPAIYQKAQ